MNTYTAFCENAAYGGNMWVSTIQADNLEEAIETAKRECAENWDLTPAEIHVLGIAEGTVKLMYWDD